MFRQASSEVGSFISQLLDFLISLALLYFFLV
jgi:hypothetical protein